MSGNTTDTSVIISDLAENTTYYGDVASITGTSTVVNGSEFFEFTTGTELSEKRFEKPTIKKRKKRKFRVNFKDWKDARADGELDYVSYIILQIKNKKKTKVVKKFKKISPTKNFKQVLKKHTKKDKTYYVRMRAEYTTGEKTKYSKWVKAKLKASK